MLSQKENLFYQKITSPEQKLDSAIFNNKILIKYCEREPHQKRETKNQYIERVRKESLQDQFVRVRFNKRLYYVRFGISGPVKTKVGKFQIIPAEVINGNWGTHYILIYPDLKTLLNKKDILVRIDSGCYSGMVLGDITCDCAGQLRKSQNLCVRHGAGIIITIPAQDGRGWGEFKMANQRLMDDLKMTTVEAAETFYQSKEICDIRTYNECAIILKSLGFTSKNHFLMATNNPAKINAFKKLNLPISGIKALVITRPNGIVKKNLEAKKKIWNHIID